MNTWKVILATMVIFGAGVLTGGLLVRQSDRVTRPRVPRGPAVVRPVPPVSPGGLRLEFLRRAQRELDLTPAQHERMDRILRESQERTRKLMEPISPQLREELRQAKEAFREVLTPAQQARFDQLMKHQQQQQQRPRDQRRPGVPAPAPPLPERPVPGSAPIPPADSPPP